MLKNIFYAALPFVFGALFALVGVGILKAAIRPDDNAAITFGVVLFIAAWVLTFALVRRFRE